MSNRRITIRKVSNGELVKVGIDEDNGIGLDTLERVFPKIRILGYYDVDHVLCVMDYRDGKVYPSTGEEWQENMIYVPVFSYNTSPDSSNFLTIDKGLMFYQYLYAWWTGKSYKTLKND